MSTLKERIEKIKRDTPCRNRDLVKMTGLSSAAVSLWTTPNEEKRSLTIKWDNAVAIASGTGYRAEWIYSGEMPEKAIDVTSSRTNTPETNIANSMQTLPVVEWGMGVEMLSLRNEELTRSGQFDGYTAPGIQSDQAKFFVVPDDAMAPDILRGEYVAMDPVPKPVRGDYVLVRKLSTGELMMRQFRPVDPGEFNAVPLNKNKYDPLNSKQHGLELIAVLVGHWSGRRSERQ